MSRGEGPFISIGFDKAEDKDRSTYVVTVGPDATQGDVEAVRAAYALGLAWAEVEAVLPERSFLRVGHLVVVDYLSEFPNHPERLTDQYEARAHLWDEARGGYMSYVSGEGDSPAEALIALAAELRRQA